MSTANRVAASLVCVGVAVSVGFSSITVGQPTARQMTRTKPAASYVSDEVLVKFKSSATSPARINAMSNMGDKPMQMSVGSHGLTLVKLPHGRGVEDAINTYRAMSDVESVQPNYIYRKLTVPNDPSYAQLWGLHNTGQAVVGGSFATSRVPGADIGAESAWDINGGDCGSVIVAVLDSGVNYTHADLAGNMWDGSGAGFPNHGANFVPGELASDPMPVDADGHGTHVAATIGAVGNNSIGMTGVCWQVQLMALRALTASGGTTASVVSGLAFAVNHGAKIVNMSFGGSAFDPAFQNEIVNARDNGVIVVVAAGNDGTNNDNPATPQYPCNFSQDNVICVAALEQAYGITTFSNFGPINVDVGAPGANVLSAWPGPTIADDFSTGWTFPNGGWVHVVCSFGTAPIDLLVDPSGFCSPPPFPTYAADANHLAYKAFNLTGVSHASAGFFRFLDTELGNDFLGFAHSTTAGDPFTTNAGSITEESGTSNGFAEEKSLSLDDCLTASCTFGLRLRSNSTTTANEFGVGILLFEIRTTQTGSNTYQVLSGTSMATPHVSGIAAAVWAYNPNYTYADVVNSVKFGGDPIPALQGITATGRAADASGSLRFINAPTGVSAVF